MYNAEKMTSSDKQSRTDREPSETILDIKEELETLRAQFSNYFAESDDLHSLLKIRALGVKVEMHTRSIFNALEFAAAISTGQITDLEKAITHYKKRAEEIHYQFAIAAAKYGGEVANNFRSVQIATAQRLLTSEAIKARNNGYKTPSIIAALKPLEEEIKQDKSIIAAKLGNRAKYKGYNFKSLVSICYKKRETIDLTGDYFPSNRGRKKKTPIT